MIYKISSKIVLLFMAVAMFFNNISLPAVNFGSGGDMTISYEFENGKSYSAAGTVSISDAADRSYDLYWGDENGKVLTVESNGTEDSTEDFRLRAEWAERFRD